MVKRILLIILIISMCIVVAIGGNITLVNSHSILKSQNNKQQSMVLYKIFIDITENRLYLIKNDKAVKSYPISPGKQDTQSPIGTWKIRRIDKMDKSTGGYYLELNVPWRCYAICSSDLQSIKESNADSKGYIRMFNDDIGELCRVALVGTPVEIYGGPYGPFGNGFRKISPGDKGSDVYEIEKRLKTMGYFQGTINGIYGDELRAAIRSFQRNNKLRISDTMDYEFYIKLGITLMD